MTPDVRGVGVAKLFPAQPFPAQQSLQEIEGMFEHEGNHDDFGNDRGMDRAA